MEFRRLTLADLDSCFENRLRALAASPEAFMTTLEEQKERGNQSYRSTLSEGGNDKAIFGAVENGKVVATCGIFYGDRPRERHKATIWGMFVDVDQRGKGVGAKVLDLALEFAREKPGTVVYLACTVGNEKAKALYESRGFTCWGTEPAAMRDGTQEYDEHQMALRLG